MFWAFYILESKSGICSHVWKGQIALLQCRCIHYCTGRDIKGGVKFQICNKIYNLCRLVYNCVGEWTQNTAEMDNIIYYSPLINILGVDKTNW